MKTHTLKYYLTRDGQEYKVEFYYSKGGVNYLSGHAIDRGYYIAVVPVTRTYNEMSDNSGYWTESFIMFNGVKRFVQGCRAFSQKTLDRLSNNWEQSNQELIDNMINHCVQKGWVTEKKEYA